MSTQQLALALFDELAPRGEAVTSAPTDLGFRRNNIFVDLDNLSLTARRAIDVAYFLVAQDAQQQQLYEADLNFFKWLMNYSSNNRRHLRAALREAQKAAVEVTVLDDGESDERWAAVPLLGPVGISNGRIYFEVPKQLERHIKCPETSHFLSLCFVFKSVHAKVIFDKLQPFAEDDSGLTPWYDLDTLRNWLGCTAKTYQEFKYLKRYVLEPAVTQINEVSNLLVSFDTQNTPGSKKVGSVRFRVRQTKTVETGKTAMLVLKALYTTLKVEFGLSVKHFNEIMAQRSEWTDERLIQAMEYTKYNIARGQVKHSVAGYFMKALREGYNVGTHDVALLSKQPVTLPPTDSADSVAERKKILSDQQTAAQQQLSKQASLGYKIYSELTPLEQQQIFAAFSRTDMAKLVAKRLNIEHHELEELVVSNQWVQDTLGLYILNQGRAPVTIGAT